jgi:hypothetical protein
MALRTLGTNSTTSLVALSAWATSLTNADFANMADAITDDLQFGTVLGQPQAGVKAVLATGSTHASTLLDTLVAVSGPGLAQIQVGDLVLGAGVVPGTFVAAKPTGTSVTLSQAATGNAAGVRVAFARFVAGTGSGDITRDGRLFVPNRGILKVLPGDIIAIDNIGFPYLVPATSIGYAGSLWNLT